MAPQVISVIGVLNADLFFITNRMPEVGETLCANDYHEALGGKGCNAAIATQRSCHKRPAALNASLQSVDDDQAAAAPPTTDISNSTATVHRAFDSIPPDPSDAAANVQTVPNTTSNPDSTPTPQPVFTEKPGNDSDDDIQVRMIGAVGDDKYGPMFRNTLIENGVDTTGVITVPNKRSGFGIAIVEHYTGQNMCLFVKAASAVWKKEDFTTVTDLGSGVRPDLVVAQLEIHKEVVEQMIEIAGHNGIDFLLNAAPADPITIKSYRYITHLLVNEQEAATMSGRDPEEVSDHPEAWPIIAEEFLKRGVPNVVLTLGDKGAYYATNSERGHVPAYKVKVVDVTGAGDTFTGFYASEYLRQKNAGYWDIKSAVIRANKASACTICKWGCLEGIPWEDEIDEFDAELNESQFLEVPGGDKQEATVEEVIKKEEALEVEAGPSAKQDPVPETALDGK